ncbi:MAG: iron-sulfur cluster assembly accessory protein [Lentisphaeria bacterium]|nr:iron-sulfur cluster assembly accessory protein [Lentisphaeria bacterium]
MNISMTDKARKQLLDCGVGADKFLRIGVKSGGCAGMTFDALLDEGLQENDEVIYEDGNIRVVADQRSSLFLDGLNIDYSDDLISAGFRLTNSQADSACGCGASFSMGES